MRRDMLGHGAKVFAWQPFEPVMWSIGILLGGAIISLAWLALQTPTRTTMKLTTITLALALVLSSTFAIAHTTHPRCGSGVGTYQGYRGPYDSYAWYRRPSNSYGPYNSYGRYQSGGLSTRSGDARAGPIHARTFTGTSGSYVSPHLDATCRGRRREILSESRMRYVASAFMWRVALLVPSSAAN